MGNWIPRHDTWDVAKVFWLSQLIQTNPPETQYQNVIVIIPLSDKEKWKIEWWFFFRSIEEQSKITITPPYIKLSSFQNHYITILTYNVQTIMISIIFSLQEKKQADRKQQSKCNTGA